MKAKKIYELHRAVVDDDVKPSIDLSIGGGVYWGYTEVIEIIDGDGKK